MPVSARPNPGIDPVQWILRRRAGNRGVSKLTHRKCGYGTSGRASFQKSPTADHAFSMLYGIRPNWLLQGTVTPSNDVRPTWHPFSRNR